MTTPAPIPQADTTLAALAVVDQYGQGNYANLDALLDATDHRELVIGLLDLSTVLATMLARAGETTVPSVIEHVRESVVSLVNDGQLSPGSFQFPE